MPLPSSSLELRPSSRSLNSSPFDGQRNPTGRVASPAVRPGDTATTLAWRNARDTYRKSLPDKDFKRIMIPAGPEDVLKEIEKWQSRQAKSKYCRVANSVQAGISRLQQFNRAVDLIAQGTPAPGCLVWGSIVFVLTIVQNAAEEYVKLCKTLHRMIECLPHVELYTETFLDSNLVQDSVNTFYCSVLRFWTRACKFYRRHRLWNFVRIVWNDYDAEFGELEIDMVRCRDRVEASALAEHIGDSKDARTQQRTVNTSLLEAQNSSRQKDVIAWLAPTGYAVDYYMEDFANAKAVRHDNTCQWLLARDAFVQFSQAITRAGAFLWIYAQPGAGKTVLAAFLVDHFASRQPSVCVLFFFCKDTDEDKRTSVAIARSLLYQLFLALRERAAVSALIEELSLAMDESGHKTALSFSAVWKIFSNHISDLTSATIVVDALDECRDSEILIQSLRSMASSCNVAVILTSRKEEHLYQLLHQSPSLEVAPDDIDVDIKAFVEAKVAASPRLSQPSVKQLVVKRLCESHEGMFLWVQYMVKELKSCVSLQQVQQELRELPKGLDAMYQRILQRLQETLDKQTLNLCSKVLTWVTTAIRPLKIDELRQALQSHYLREGHSLLSTGGSFPYSDKDIELVCGSLVTVRNETLQVVHLTVKEFIKAPSGLTTLRLLADTKGASLQLTLVCLSFLRHECAEPIAKISQKRPIGARRSKRPFLEYACFSWLSHLTDCTSPEALEVSRSVYRTFDSPSTFGWIESCIALAREAGSVTRLRMGLEDVRDWFENLQLDRGVAEGSSFSFVSNWCATMEQVLEEYSPVMKKRTDEVYYLDFASAFAAHGLSDTYEKFGGLARREKCTRFPTNNVPSLARKKVPPNLRLQHSERLQLLSNGRRLSPSLFVHEPNREIFIWSYDYLPDSEEVLFAQSATSGRRLLPVGDPDTEQRSKIKSFAISKDGRYLGIVSVGSDYIKARALLISIWEIEVTPDFTRRMQASSWARIVHRSIIDEPSIAQLWSNPCIAFDHDGLCFTPNGLVRTALGAISFDPDDIFQRLSARNDHCNLDSQCAFYSGNGKFLFLLSRTTITKYAFPCLEVHFQRPRSYNEQEFLMASPSGRYLAFLDCDQDSTASNRDCDQDSMASDLDFDQPVTLLVDTLLGNTMILPYSAGQEQRKEEDGYALYFSVDEREVFACYLNDFAGSKQLTISCYAGLPNQARLRASGKCVCDPIDLSVGLHVSSDHKTARLLTYSGAIQQIGLGDEIEFFDAPDETSVSYFLSKDGTRWASVYDGINKAQIQIRKVLDPDETPPCIELQRTSSLSDEWSKFVAMSMDLSILVLDGDIYRIGDSKIGQVSIAPQTFELPKELTFSQSDQGMQPICLVDSSNSYVAYAKRNQRPGYHVMHPDAFALFRINLDETSSPRLQPSLPEDMFDISLQFHPSFPLLIVGFGLISEVRFHVVIIDLNTMTMGAVEIEQLPDPWDRWLFSMKEEVAFSSSGDFAYTKFDQWDKFKECYLPRWRIIKDNVKVSSISYRYMQRSLVVDGALYKLNVDGCSIHLELALPWPEFFSTGTLPNLVSLSSSYVDRCKAFLLLGQTDEDEMRILFIPENGCVPEVKTIPLTWAEARAILDRKREDQMREDKRSLEEYFQSFKRMIDGIV